MAANAEATVTLSLIDRVTGPIRRIAARLGNLSKRIGLDKVAASIGNIGARLKGLGDGLARTSGRIVSLFGLLGAGGAGVAVAAFNLAKSTSDIGSEIHDTAAKLGIGVEALQEYRFAASQSGVETATFDKGVEKLGVNAVLASKGNKELAKSFKTLGVHVKDTHGKMRSTEDILDDTMLALTKIKDPLTRNALAFKLFGKSGVELTKILQDGAGGLKDMREEARKTGSIMGKSATDAADAMGDSVDSLMKRVEGFKLFLGAQLMPVITDVVQNITAWVDANAGLIRSTITEWVQNLGQFMKDLADPTSQVRVKFDEFASAVSSAYGEIKPFIDFLGGPGKAALMLIGLWALAPAITAITLLATAFGGLGLSIASVALSTVSGLSGAVANLAGAGLGKALEASGVSSGALWGKAFSVAAKLAIIVGIASIVADVLEKYDPKGNLGGITKPVDDYLRNKLGLPAKDTGITPGEIWKGLFGSNDSKPDANAPGGQGAPPTSNKTSWTNQPEALSPVARDLGFDQSNVFGYQPIKMGTTDTLPGKTKDDAISQDVITSNSNNTTTIDARSTISVTITAPPDIAAAANAAVRDAISEGNKKQAAAISSSLSD